MTTVRRLRGWLSTSSATRVSDPAITRATVPKAIHELCGARTRLRFPVVIQPSLRRRELRSARRL